MRYLLDTCVISELISKRPNPGVVAWVDTLDKVRIAASEVGIGRG